MPSSPIRKLMPYANAAKASGKRVIHLNIGQPDIATPEIALSELKADTRTVVEYSPSEGYASYRDGLSTYYKGAGIDVNADDIVVTTGGSEALVFGFMSCMDPGDEVIIPEPFYANYRGFAQMAGVKIVPVTATIEDGFELPPISDFEKRITPRTKAILICNPGNPTGKVYAPEAMDNLAQIVRDNDLYLFSDEVYREFCYDGAVAKSVVQLDGIENNVVLIDSVSKRYSMCGARIGAIVSRNKSIIQTALKFSQSRLSPPTFGQLAAIEALKTKKEYFQNVIAEYDKRRQLLVSELNKINGVKCPMPKGAFYCIAELPIKNAELFCQWLLEKFHLNHTTVMLAPANGFYSARNTVHNQVRIAYVLESKKLKLATKIIKKALENYQD